MKESTNAGDDLLTLGDIVSWKGHWGANNPSNVEVIGIIITPEGGSDRSLGTPIDSIPWNKLIGKNILVGIKPGLWAYGSQLDKKVL
jgi:hypothetical protein